jgi:hypothetical protein
MALLDIEPNLVQQALGQALERLPVIEARNPKRLALFVEVGPDPLEERQLLLEPFLDARLEDLEHPLVPPLVAKRHDYGDTRLSERGGLEGDTEPIEPPELTRQYPADIRQGNRRRQRFESLQLQPQLGQEPPVARQHLSELVQRRAASRQPCEPLGDGRRGRQRGLVPEDRVLMRGRQSFEKDGQRPLDRPPVMCVRLRQHGGDVGLVDEKIPVGHRLSTESSRALDRSGGPNHPARRRHAMVAARLQTN